MATISTHNGSAVSIEHNERYAQFIKNEMAKRERNGKEAHIRLDGEHEVWRSGNLRNFYKERFQDSVDEYNAKQKREDRKIHDYYEKISKDKKKNLAYELIVGVYGRDVSPEVGKAIVREFFDGWDERNPNLELVSCGWHHDERGKNGHAHHAYVPVAHNCRTGPTIGTSLNQALKEMGFIDKGPLTAQIQWEARENKLLEEICRSHGLVVEREKEKRQHQETETFILEQRAEEASQRLSEALTGIEEARDTRDELDVQIAHREARKASLSNDLEQSADLIQQLNDDVRHAIQSSRKQPIERLEENPAKKNIFGKETQPPTALVVSSQLDELERSPGLTPSDTWKLSDIESGIRKVRSTIDLSRERQLEDRVQELEREVRQRDQQIKTMNRKINLVKDWAIDIIERELSKNRIGQFIIQNISQMVRNAFDNIEKSAIDMSQSQDRGRRTR